MEEVYLEERQIDKLVSVERFKQHTAGLKALIAKVEVDLRKRYTPFTRSHFANFFKDLKAGIEIINIVSVELADDLKYSNLQFMIEPFRNINQFTGGILEMVLDAFQSCYTDYLRICAENQKISDKWAPEQQLFKREILGETLKSEQLKRIEKSDQQDQRNFDSMIEAIENKKTHVMFLNPVTEVELNKMEKENEHMIELVKTIIDQSCKELTTVEDSINKSWDDQAVNRWKAGYSVKIKALVDTVNNWRVYEKKEDDRKANKVEQETQTEKSRKDKRMDPETMQREIESKSKRISELEEDIKKAKVFFQFSEMKKAEEQEEREKKLTRGMMQKNADLEKELQGLKSFYDNKEKLIFKKLSAYESRMVIMDVELSKSKKELSYLKTLDQQDMDYVCEEKGKDKENEQITRSIDRISSFNSLESGNATFSKIPYSRMSKELRNGQKLSKQRVSIKPAEAFRSDDSEYTAIAIPSSPLAENKAHLQRTSTEISYPQKNKEKPLLPCEEQIVEEASQKSIPDRNKSIPKAVALKPKRSLQKPVIHQKQEKMQLEKRSKEIKVSKGFIYKSAPKKVKFDHQQFQENVTGARLETNWHMNAQTQQEQPSVRTIKSIHETEQTEGSFNPLIITQLQERKPHFMSQSVQTNLNKKNDFGCQVELPTTATRRYYLPPAIVHKERDPSFENKSNFSTQQLKLSKTPTRGHFHAIDFYKLELNTTHNTSINSSNRLETLYTRLNTINNAKSRESHHNSSPREILDSIRIPSKVLSPVKRMVSVSRGPAVMMKFLERIRKIDKGEYNVFERTLRRWNKYSMSEGDHVEKRVSELFSCYSTCTSCLLFRLFVEKMDAVDSWIQGVQEKYPGI